MNKPLTIEQLKNFKRGDWVWLIVKRAYGNYGTYDNIVKICDNEIQFEYCIGQNVYPFDEYGKTWLAYKNKEQAEAKGEIVELQPPTIKDTFQGAVIEWEIVTKNHIICDTYSEAERRLLELTEE